MKKVRIAIGLESRQRWDSKLERHWFEQEMTQIPCECHQREEVGG